ncbi:hypothetical protein E3U43_016898 [Larimichthys crocea]|uniref:Uncharacterized protein n=1 Tax=Larimichthys crocea TaxID=215358 RepID=A0ACD3QXR2_LARCR|nr:hypothetical protein E3U43_016898 [Larimichthys crocea]
MLYGEFIPCVSPMPSEKNSLHLTGITLWADFDSLCDSRRSEATLNLRGFTYLAQNARLRVVYKHRLFCRLCRKQDTAVSCGYKGNAQSTTEASSLLDRYSLTEAKL